MPCKEWCELVERYRTAVHTYNEAVKALDVSPGTAFSETWQRAEWARTKCSRDRADLMQHEHTHGCSEVGQLNGKKQVSSVKTEDLVLGDQGQPGG
jgi:hypothetical protein